MKGDTTGHRPRNREELTFRMIVGVVVMAFKKAAFHASYLVFLVIIALGLFFFNAISSKHFIRKDLTDDKLFSVSEAFKRILLKLEDPVDVTLYLSREVPDQFKNLRRDTIDKFKEFEIYSGGNFRWKIVDPDKKEETRDKLKSYGIPQLEGGVIKKEERSSRRFYSGIRISYMEKRPVIVPEYYDVQSLEYDLASKFMQLVREHKPRIQFFTSIESEPAPQVSDASPRYQVYYDQYTPIMDIDDIKDKFAVTRTKLTRHDTVDESTDCLVIAQPDKLNQRQKYEINRYLYNGGNVIVFVSKRTIVKERRLMFKYLDPKLDDLFRFWGFDVEDKMVADLYSGQMVRTRFQRGEIVQNVGRSPLIVKAIGKGLNQESPITRRIESLNFPWVAPIVVDSERLADNGLKATALVQSSAKSWVLTDPSRYVSDIVPPESEADFDGNQTLVMLVNGKFPMYYTQVPKWPEEDGNEAAVASADADVETTSAVESKQGKLLLVSSVDVIKFNYWQHMQIDPSYRNNVLFFLNSLELFSMGEDLIEVRMKTQTARKLDETTMSQKLMLKIFNIGVVPALVVICGVIRVIWRRREKKHYLKNLRSNRKSESVSKPSERSSG